jgi:ATP-dependent helicase/nuclease subunit A
MTQKAVHNSVHIGSDDPLTAREIDPNVLQNRASDTNASVWVSASAGTGKTKVLTDRVLRLLLPQEGQQTGTPPHKILCLTFTKAAASEMALRISRTLSAWASMDELALADSLRNLLGRAPKPPEIAAAQRLFADVVDAPGGLQIMTIHAFCQSVLSRFPLEADLTPYFSPLTEDEAAALLRTAQADILSGATQAEYQQALHHIAQTIGEDDFAGLLKNVIAERHQLRSILSRYNSIDELYSRICKALNTQPGQSAAQYLRQQCDNDCFDHAGLTAAVKALREYGTDKTDIPRADKITAWLALLPNVRAEEFEHYKEAYFKSDGEGLFAKFTTEKVNKNAPETAEILQTEAERLLQIHDHLKHIRCARLTHDLITIAAAILQRYEDLKHSRSGLDFDDLILKTLALLSNRTRALENLPHSARNQWVSYKLDEGLDHILIDEAQDTNPEQWQIIQALCADFFSGDGARDIPRTVFAVGDQKQSIYSFQRASPREFQRMQAYFAQKVEDAGQAWDNIPLQTSFRSTASVLRAVDAVFANPAYHSGFGDGPPQHFSHRRGQAGLVELWPIFETEKPPEQDPWEPPTQIIERSGGAAALAEHIAATVQRWLDNREILTAQGRPIKPGDIMILVRTRTRFVDQVSKALKNRNIPISGVDRMVLNDQLAVQDLLAAADFALLPDDDLSLACLLKSPLIGMDETALMDLAATRKGTLWQALRDSDHAPIITYCENIIALCRTCGPFDFFSQILQNPCPADTVSALRSIKRRLGEDAQDPLDELLSASLEYEQQHAQSLQQFIHWQRQGKSEIKRDMEAPESSDGPGKVRIMTIHGAKGLQAPIVILPDTLRSVRHSPAQHDRRLLWPDKTGLDVPLWAPRKELQGSLFREALSHFDARMDEEHRRLLYVAMTRAEDRLYVGGFATQKKPLPDSWYFMIENALKSAADIETLEGGIVRLENPQAPDQKPDALPATPSQMRSLPALPDWAYRPAPQEESVIAGISASHALPDEEPVNTPLQRAQNHRFLRGNLTHKLLEILPQIPPPKRASAARDFVSRFGSALSPAVQGNIVDETMALLEHPEFSVIFGPGSRAEVPLTGLLEGRTRMTGQIDRLLITQEAIWIIDYKTNRPPPDKPEDVPAIYQRQLQSYARILAAIYPGRALKCALLWTDGPRLMPITVSLD